jgi:hypothetical protein
MAALLPLIAGGCAQTVEVQTFVLDADIVAAPQPVPLHVTTPESKHAFTISPSVSIGTGKTMTGDVEGSPPSRAAAFYPVDTARGQGGQLLSIRRVPQDNLSWTQPDYSIGLDLDYAGSSVALALGANIASAGGVDLWGAHGGLGIFGQTKGGMGVRLDMGVSWQAASYDVESVVITTTSWDFLSQSSTDTGRYVDTGDEAKFGYYIAMTFNSAGEDWPVNGFLQVSLARQTLFDFEPSSRATYVFPFPVDVANEPSGAEVSTAVSVVSLTPGLFTNLGKDIRLLAGARVWWDMSETITSGAPGVHPFLQVDFILPTGE